MDETNIQIVAEVVRRRRIAAAAAIIIYKSGRQARRRRARVHPISRLQESLQPQQNVSGMPCRKETSTSALVSTASTSALATVEEGTMLSSDESVLSEASTPLLEYSSSSSSSSSDGESPFNTVARRKRKMKKTDDTIDRFVAALREPIQLRPAPDTWQVSREVQLFCRYIGCRLDEMPENKRRRAELRIVKALRDPEEENEV